LAHKNLSRVLKKEHQRRDNEDADLRNSQSFCPEPGVPNRLDKSSYFFRVFSSRRIYDTADHIDSIGIDGGDGLTDVARMQAAGEDDGEPFDEKMARLTAELREQTKQSTKLDKLIWANLEDIGYGD
jgi:hypothetical protein